MLRIILAVALAAAFFVPALATADEGTKDNGLSYCDENYLDLYDEVDPGGPNIVKDGVDGEPATEGRICRKVDVLYDLKQDQIAAVAAAEAAAAESTTATTSTTTSTGSGNAYVDPACESGGDPQVVDASGTYWGKYQFDAATWAASGGDPAAYGSADEATQDAVAANVTYDAWPNC